MTATDYLRVLRRQWWVLFLLTAIGASLACAYTFTATPMYSAQTRMFVSAGNGRTGVSDLSTSSTFAQQRVKSYVDIVTADQVMTDVIASLGLRTTARRLEQQVTADSPLDTVLLNVTVQDADPAQAAAIANAVAAAFPGFVEELETNSDSGSDSGSDTAPDTALDTAPDTASDTGRTASPVQIRVTRPATAATAPSSPRTPLNIALGLLVGLGLGVGLAVLRDQLNTSVTTPADVELVTGLRPLGIVPYDRTAARQPLIDLSVREGRAESFRSLRTNLQFANVDDPPRVILVTSALPGEGKTSTACNLALTLAYSGATVALVEADLRKPRVCAYLGLSSAAGLTSVLADRDELRDVLVQYQDTRVAVVPAGPTPPNPSELLGSQQMTRLVTGLGNHFDCVIIDAPPLLPVTDAAVLSALADGAVLVARHGVTSRESLERAVQTLAAVNAKLLGTVLNSVPVRRGKGYAGYGYSYGDPVVPGQRAPRPGGTVRGLATAGAGGRGGIR